MQENPIYSENRTAILDMEVRKPAGEAAEIVLRPISMESTVPDWDEKHDTQAVMLMDALKAAFGEKNVQAETMLEGLRYTVKAPEGVLQEEHLKTVAKLVDGFAQQHSFELETSDPTHFRDIVTGAAEKRDVRAGIQSIMDDQLLDKTEKVDALTELFKAKMKAQLKSGIN